MKHTRIITEIDATQLNLPSVVLEDIVNHRTQKTKYHYPVTGIEKDLYCKDLDVISSYTIETTLKGNLELKCYNNRLARNEIVQVPVASSFLVTCIKAKEHRYRVKFVSSLN